MAARLVFAGLILVAAPAAASETITYQYDALGRLVQVTRSGTVNNGASATYTYDPANNRTNVTTTAPTGGGMAQAKPSHSKDQPSQSSGTGNALPRR
jgi:YD repeat-containing protein